MCIGAMESGSNENIDGQSDDSSSGSERRYQRSKPAGPSNRRRVTASNSKSISRSHRGHLLTEYFFIVLHGYLAILLSGLAKP